MAKLTLKIRDEKKMDRGEVKVRTWTEIEEWFEETKGRNGEVVIVGFEAEERQRKITPQELWKKEKV